MRGKAGDVACDDIERLLGLDIKELFDSLLVLGIVLRKLLGMLVIDFLADSLDEGCFYSSHSIICKPIQIITSDLMPLKALGYFLSGAIGSILSVFLGSYVGSLFSLLPLSIPYLVVNAIIVGLFVLIGHLIIHKVLRID